MPVLLYLTVIVFVVPLGMSNEVLPMTTVFVFAFVPCRFAVKATTLLATSFSVMDKVTVPAHPPVPELQEITTCAPWIVAVRREMEDFAAGGGGGGGGGDGAAAGTTGAITVRLLNGAIPYWMSPPGR